MTSGTTGSAARSGPGGNEGSDYLKTIAEELTAIRKTLQPPKHEVDEKVQSTLDLVDSLRGSLLDGGEPVQDPPPPVLTATWKGGSISDLTFGDISTDGRWIHATQRSGAVADAQLSSGAAKPSGLDATEPLAVLALCNEKGGPPIAIAGPIDVT